MVRVIEQSSVFRNELKERGKALKDFFPVSFNCTIGCISSIIYRAADILTLAHFNNEPIVSLRDFLDRIKLLGKDVLLIVAPCVVIPAVIMGLFIRIIHPSIGQALTTKCSNFMEQNNMMSYKGVKAYMA